MQIKFLDVSYTYSPKTPYEFNALKDVNLDIKEGSFTGIVGKTGCGKSTLIQHLNGLLIPTSGEVNVDTYVLTNNKKRRTKKLKDLRKKVGVVFQFSENQLFEETILKDVMFGPLNFGAKADDARKISIECLKKVGIPESYFEKSPFELSGGEKRRVAIAGILAMSPDVLVLDEPTAGLDPTGTKEIMNLFKTINEEGKTVIFVTHDMSLVLEYATNVIVMKDKEIVKEATPAELFIENQEEYNLETPQISLLAKALIDKGLKLDLTKVKDISSLVDEIVKGRAK